MQEYKREKASLESRVQELEKNHTDHDDHIRVVDAWLHQVSLLPHFSVRNTAPNAPQLVTARNRVTRRWHSIISLSVRYEILVKSYPVSTSDFVRLAIPIVNRTRL